MKRLAVFVPLVLAQDQVQGSSSSSSLSNPFSSKVDYIKHPFSGVANNNCWSGLWEGKRDACCAGSGDLSCFVTWEVYWSCCFDGYIQREFPGHTWTNLPQCPPPPDTPGCEQDNNEICDKDDPNSECYFQHKNYLFGVSTFIYEYYLVQPLLEHKLFYESIMRLVELYRTARCMSFRKSCYQPIEWDVLCRYMDQLRHQLLGANFKSFMCHKLRPMHPTDIHGIMQNIIQEGIKQYQDRHDMKRFTENGNDLINGNVYANFDNPQFLPPRQFNLWFPYEWTPNHMCKEEHLSGYPFAEMPFEIRPLGRTFSDVTGFFTPHLAIEEMVQFLSHPTRGVRMSKKIVNLGANDGSCHSPFQIGNYDPANCLAHAFNFGGVFIEASDHWMEYAQNRYAGRPDIDLVQTIATPDNIVDIVFARLNGTMDIDLLKIDIDHSDCTFARRLIQAGLRPKIIHIEINSAFPPPIIYREHFNANQTVNDVTDSNFDLYGMGCSVAAVLEDVGPDYRLFQVEFEDAVFLRSDVLTNWGHAFKDPEILWRIGYYCHPLAQALRYGHMWPRENPHLWADQRIPLNKRLEYIKNALPEGDFYDLGILSRYDSPHMKYETRIQNQ